MYSSLPWAPNQVIYYNEHDNRPEQKEEEGNAYRKCVHLHTESGTSNFDSIHYRTRRVEEGNFLVHTLETETHESDDILPVECQSECSNVAYSEKAIMEKLFQACDHQGKGKVKVSDLVEYLGTLVDMQLHGDGAVSNLVAILDPDNVNLEIGSEEFYKGLHKWIQEMKSAPPVEMSKLYHEEDSILYVGHNSMMESLLEESVTDDKLSVSELSHRLTDSQYLNQKLSAENQEARAVIDNKEEELCKSYKQLQEAQQEIKRLQELADFRHEAETENEELRQQLIVLSKKLDREKHRVHQAEQEKTVLQVQMQRYQSQVAKLTADLALSREQLEELRSNQASSKETIAQLKEFIAGCDAQLAEKDEYLQDLRTCLQELSKTNEVLKDQNEELQAQLIQTQQELLSVKATHVTPNAIQLPSLKKLADEIEEDTEHIDLNVTSEFPLSIRNELKDLLNDSPSLPCPLSKKELKEGIASAPDLVSQVGSAINSLSSDGQAYRPDMDEQVGQSSEKKVASLDKNLCCCDFHYDVPIEKLRLLVSLLRNFREENHKLKKYVKSNFASSPVVDFKLMEKISESPGQAGAASNEDLPLLLRQCLSEAALQKNNKKLLLEMTKLKRSNLKLAENLHKTELRLNEVIEEAQNTSANLDKEQQRCAELEESLCSSTLARQLDLRDIWRLVQKEVESECQDLQEDGFNHKPTDQIKEKIKREIEALRTKLRKREATLGALKENNLNFPSAYDNDETSQTCNWYSGNTLPPGSPLFDALTIDVFNGNFPMYQPEYPYPPSVVSCEDVDCCECRAARLVLQNRYTTSCPSIAPPNTGNLLTFDETSAEGKCNEKDDNFSSLKTTIQTIETATGNDFVVSNAPKRKRSLYGSHRRQDFIRHSGRFLQDKTAQHPKMDQHSWSLDDPKKGKRNDVSNNNTTNNSQSYQSFEGRNNISHSYLTNDLATGSSSANNVETPVGVRRPSFTYAIELSQWGNHNQLNTLEEYETQRDHCTFTDELRRPSFHAAIEHSRVQDSCRKSQDIQIPASENQKIPSTAVLSRCTKKNKLEKNKRNLTCSDLSKSVKFNLDKKDTDFCGEVYTGAIAWGSPSHTANLDAVGAAMLASSTSLSSSLSSAKASTSFDSPQSAFSGNLNYNLYPDSSQGRKLQIPIEETHCKIVEDWDMSPNATPGVNTVFLEEFISTAGKSEQETENMQTSMRNGKEGKEKNGDRRASESLQGTSDNLASMNQNSYSVKEVRRGHSARDGPAHSMPDRFSGHQASKLPVSGNPSKPLSVQSTRPSHTATFTPTNHPLPSPSPALPPQESTTLPSSEAPVKQADQGHGKPEDVNKNVQSAVRKGECELQVSVDSYNNERESSSRLKTVVPASPPTNRSSLSIAQQAQPLGPSKLSKIRQDHLASKKREQMKSKSMKLPEVAEHSELDTSATTNGSVTLSTESSFTSKAMPQISVTDEDADLPPAPADDPVTPSLPDSFLRKLGLAVNPSVRDQDRDNSVDQLPEKEVESKFVSLSLAFRTDKLTLDQRVGVQERARDLAEQNVDTELQELRDAVETLSELISDAQVRTVLHNIKQHIDVLEQSAARVSSRAEVFGAVQQERRMCKAMEIMVMYTENLRRIREKEESELLEARKLLSERSGSTFGLDSELGPNRRSMSVCGFSASGRPMRRRSEVALPRVLGGIGSPPLTPTASLESTHSFLERSNLSALSQESDEGEDPRSRFQSAVASTSMQYVVTSTMRRSSMEKQRSMLSTPFLSPTSISRPSPVLTVTKEDSIPESTGDKIDLLKKVSQDEEAFRKGFEEGLKTKLSQELNDLREQQNSISHNLENVMDKVDQSQHEDEEYLSRPSRLEFAVVLAARIKECILQYEWRSNKKLFRNIAGVFCVFFAILLVFLCPPISTLDVTHFPKPPQ